MTDAWQEVKYAVRVLARARAVSAFAILSLALGIGANTAVFSLFNAYVLRPLAVPDPEQLVEITTLTPAGPEREEHLSLAMLAELRRNNGVFSTVFAWSGGYRMANFQVNGVRYASGVADADGEYFAALGVRPLLGRLFTAEDGGTAPVAVLDYRCWRDRFHSDAAVIGQTIRVEGKPLTIIGVTPEKFTGLELEEAPEVTVPLGLLRGASRFDPKTMHVAAMGRLKRGVTLAQARARLEALWPAIREATIPDGYSARQRAGFLQRRIEVQSAATGISFLRERQSRPLPLLMALVGLTLLIVCVNLANLMLARATARGHEIAVRIALGAGRWRLIRQLLIESMLLSLAGAAAGLPLSQWAGRIVIRLTWSGYTPTAMTAGLDWRVLAFTAAVASAVGVLFGLAPARSILRYSPSNPFARNPRTTHGGVGGGAKLLLAGQVAISILLVTGAVLLLRTLVNLRSSDPGFRREGVLLVHLFQEAGAENIPNRTVYFRELAERIGGVAGVHSVSYSRIAPFTLFEIKRRVVAVASREAPVECVLEYPGPGFFQLMGMHVLSGREFDWGDNESAGRVAMVSESLARRLFPGQNPIGQRLDLGEHAEDRVVQIAGVVNSASLWNPRSREPLAIYLPLLQSPGQGNPMITVRLGREDPALAGNVRRAVESLGRHFPLRMQSIEEREESVLMQERMVGMMSAFFGGLALLLAAIGMYGVTSFSVTRRTSEIGVRMALGAQTGDVVRLILRETAWLLAAGIAVGAPCAMALSRLLASMVYGVSVRDGVTLGLAIVLVAGVSLCAAGLPARRAARTDPASALRAE